ncbi:Gfo/Idh/MocA family protein [Agromyces aerolatus]|uniref:Gfo/Idh/MocA family protein n=1 Tax=Agromyces sp. LY-1074 TaxID=3074080 RepID=UPI00285A5316|nr:MULTISPECIES: Gfo/Idh/MocA family oxidoreductase [unclassified Agromyces]MDR5701364.1 Gfo/Idh/MocA family oxidoreductase [Agromyces sp. LY-1074]MDR5706847.1 Gfo/Idh/MocA family oxidoreductase [Agromyces sp. LY-1358]
MTRAIVVGLASDHAWTMAEGLHLAGAPVSAVVDADAALRAKAGETFGEIAAYASLDEVPDGEMFDIALVTTDNAAKAEAIGWAVRRGSAVYADKPLSTSGAGADAALAAIGSATVPVMIAFHTVFDGVHDEAKQILQAGGIGQVHFVRGIAGHGGLKEAGVSSEFTEWLVDPERGGGGTFIDQGVYLLNTMMDQLGTPVVEVTGVAVNLGLREYIPAGVEDVSAAILRFEGGAVGVIDTKWMQIGRSPLRLAYHGTEGTLTDFGGHWILQTRVDGFAPPGAWRPEGEEAGLRTYRRDTPRSAGYAAEAAHLVRAAQEGAALHPAVSAAAAARVQHIVDAFYASVRAGAPIAVAG